MSTHRNSLTFIDGVPFVWGVPAELRPIADAPEGVRLRLRFRAGQQAKAYLRTPQGIQCHEPDDHGDHWTLGQCIGCNLRQDAADKARQPFRAVPKIGRTLPDENVG